MQILHDTILHSKNSLTTLYEKCSYQVEDVNSDYKNKDNEM